MIWYLKRNGEIVKTELNNVAYSRRVFVSNKHNMYTTAIELFIYKIFESNETYKIFVMYEWPILRQLKNIKRKNWYLRVSCPETRPYEITIAGCPVLYVSRFQHSYRLKETWYIIKFIIKWVWFVENQQYLQKVWVNVPWTWAHPYSKTE